MEESHESMSKWILRIIDILIITFDQVLVVSVHFLHSFVMICLTFKSLVHIKLSKMKITYLQISKAILVGFQ